MITNLQSADQARLGMEEEIKVLDGLGGSNRRFMVEEKIVRRLREEMWGIESRIWT